YKSFNLVNKILATLKEDRLELINDMLIPSKTVKFKKDIYLLEDNKNSINVVNLKENESIPELFFEKEDTSFSFSIVDLDEDSVKLLLEPLASTYEIEIKSTSIVDGYNIIYSKAKRYGDLENFAKSAQKLLGDKFVINENIVQEICESLIEHNKKISIAESCTGGLIASMITKNPGVSAIFDGSVVSYSNDIKHSWLGVSKDTLENFGAVSEECVREMLDGIMSASNSDFALATSGIAGPDGGTKEKPVGTVFVGAKSKDGKYIVERLLLKGDREYIQTQSAYYAFKLLMLVFKSHFFEK
ncbi:CinA family protein, partial [Hydrogenimonas sp.]